MSKLPEVRPFDVDVLLSQIGRMNVFAISGGRAVVDKAGALVLPIRYGYAVRVFLDWNDTWTVQRVFSRGGKSAVKREWREVYADSVGQIAYQASCYHDK